MANAEESTTNGEIILEMFRVHEHFCRAVIDAYVVVDSAGGILKYNSHFTKMTRLKPRLLDKANSLDDILTIEIDGKPASVGQLLRYRTPSHIEHASGKLVAGSHELNLVLGILPFIDGHRTIGAFLLIRDITAEIKLEEKYQDKALLSITDKLTGLFNRRHFDYVVPEYLEKVETLPFSDAQRQVSLVILDIDHFKKCNDTFGHQAGDYVIAEVAALLKASFRQEDTICRYGGEEFAAVLPGCGIEDAVAIAESVRVKIAKHLFECLGFTIPIAISLGVAEVAVGLESNSQAIARADAALYFAKKSGRNRACLQRRDGTLECRTA